MRNNGLKTFFIAITLVAIAVLAPRIQNTLTSSAEAYRPPADISAPAEESVMLQPPGHRVVLIILSGFSDYFWSAETMPTLQQIQKTGAQAASVSQPPTYRLPAWIELLSGTSAFLVDAPMFDVFDAAVRPSETPTILEPAATSGAIVAITGNRRWEDILPADIPAQTAFFSASAADADTQVLAQISRWVDDPSIPLIVAQFSQSEAVASAGVASKEYQTALQLIDRQLEQLRKMLDLSTTTLIITADYGRLSQHNGRGGDEPELISLPLIMAGQGIIPGKYSPVRQQDVAPTISALLGVPFPAANMGVPLFDMLSLPSADTAGVWVRLAKQRVSLTKNYIAAIGGTFSPPEQVGKLSGFMEDGNYAGTIQLAQLIVSETDDTIQAQIRAKQQAEQRSRLLISAAMALVLLWLAVWRRGSLWAEALIGAAVAVGGYRAGYQILKIPTSLSAISHLLTFEQQISKMIFGAMAAGMIIFIILVLLRRQLFLWHELLLAAYEMALWAIIGFGAPALYGFWKMGATVRWIFPDVDILFLFLSGLWHIKWAAIVGVAFPPILTLIFMGGYSLRRKLNARKAIQSAQKLEELL